MFDLRKAIRVLAPVLGVAGVAPATALGQACIGTPVGDSGIALEASAKKTEGVKAFGVNAASNPDGPFSFAVAYFQTDYDAFEQNGNWWITRLAYEVPELPFSVCPLVGFEYSRLTLPGSLFNVNPSLTPVVRSNVIVIPVGVALAKMVGRVGTVNITPYVSPHYIFQRGRLEGDNSIVFGEPEISHGFGGAAGLTLGLSRVYAGGEVSMSTADGAEPLFQARAGIAF